MFANPTNVGISQRVVATLVACAVVLASIGIYTQTAQAANLTRVSDTLSDSNDGVASDHTIVFNTPSTIANGTIITIDFSDGPFVVGAVTFDDIDVATTSDFTIGAACGAVDIAATWTGTTLNLNLCAAGGKSIPANATTTIQIGDNAIGGSGNDQLTNPSSFGSWEIVIDAGTNTGRTRVVTVNEVLVTAVVETTFEFSITGTATNTAVHTATTTGSTSPTLIAFGTLVADIPEILSQQLRVRTNARNGYTVTVESDSHLASANGAIIDTFTDGTDIAVAGTPWTPPGADVNLENEWGHWGMTSDDSDVAIDFDTAESYIAVSSTTPREIMSHDAPADGTTQDIGLATVGYQVEITALQEAADDYQTTLTYIATPTF